MTEIFKTTALSDEIEWFFVAALKGVMHEYRGEDQLCPVGSQKTPISTGLSEGFSPQDIAHFYITREIGSDWQKQLINNLSKDFRTKVETAFAAFQEDSQLEKKFYRDSLYD